MADLAAALQAARDDAVTAADAAADYAASAADNAANDAAASVSDLSASLDAAKQEAAAAKEEAAASAAALHAAKQESAADNVASAAAAKASEKAAALEAVAAAIEAAAEATAAAAVAPAAAAAALLAELTERVTTAEGEAKAFKGVAEMLKQQLSSRAAEVCTAEAARDDALALVKSGAADAAAKLDLEVAPSEPYLPRHPPHCRPSFLESNGIISRGEQYLRGATWGSAWSGCSASGKSRGPSWTRRWRNWRT